LIRALFATGERALPFDAKVMASMILGMTIPVFVHVLLSLIGIATGLVVVLGLLNGQPMGRWTALFLATTIATSVTGFFLPAKGFMPSHVLGILSLVTLTLAVVARYAFHLAGPWRWLYVVGAVISEYFNVFVLVAQAFKHVPALTALAPTQSEPPFAVAQLILLVVFVALGVLAVKRFRAMPAPA
jgi:hypothetical protein